VEVDQVVVVQELVEVLLYFQQLHQRVVDMVELVEFQVKLEVQVEVVQEMIQVQLTLVTHLL
jgi:hypothetical protein